MGLCVRISIILCFLTSQLVIAEARHDEKSKTVRQDLQDILGVLPLGKTNHYMKFKNSVTNTQQDFLSQDIVPSISVSYQEALVHSQQLEQLKTQEQVESQRKLKSKFKKLDPQIQIEISSQEANEEDLIQDTLESSKTELLYTGKSSESQIDNLTDIDWSKLNQPFSTQSLSSSKKDPIFSRDNNTRMVPDLVVSRKLQIPRDGISDLSYFSSFQNNKGYDSVQIIDERSQLHREEVYPAKNLIATIPGTAVQFKVDQLGTFQIPRFSDSSSLLLHVDDPDGNYMPAVLELELDRDRQTDKKRARVVRKFYFEHQAAAAGVKQDSLLASWCGITTENQVPRAGVRVRLDTKAAGPYYFNGDGIIDVRRKKTNSDGRFCFFNAHPGLSVASFKFPDHSSIDTPLNLYEEKHLEKDFAYRKSSLINVDLMVQSAADEERALDEDLVMSKKVLPRMDLIPLGQAASAKINSSQAEIDHDLILSGSTIYAFAHAPELEPAIYELSTVQSNKQLQLLPRGYIDDLALAAKVRNESMSGKLLVEADNKIAQGPSPLQFRLVDSFGSSVGQPLEFKLNDKQSGLFLNVPSGKYQILIENHKGQLVAAKTALVYDQSVTVSML